MNLWLRNLFPGLVGHGRLIFLSNVSPGTEVGFLRANVWSGCNSIYGSTSTGPTAYLRYRPYKWGDCLLCNGNCLLVSWSESFLSLGLLFTSILYFSVSWQYSHWFILLKRCKTSLSARVLLGCIIQYLAILFFIFHQKSSILEVPVLSTAASIEVIIFIVGTFMCARAKFSSFERRFFQMLFVYWTTNSNLVIIMEGTLQLVAGACDRWDNGHVAHM